MVTVFKKNMILLLPFSFSSSIMFVTEAVFIPEQIEQYKFGVLSKINGKFSLKLNNFSCMTLQFRLNSLRNFITILHD